MLSLTTITMVLSIWTNMYNSLVESLTKRFQCKAIDITGEFQGILSNFNECAEFPNMNPLIELYNSVNWEFLKMEKKQTNETLGGHPPISGSYKKWGGDDVPPRILFFIILLLEFYWNFISILFTTKR